MKHTMFAVVLLGAVILAGCEDGGRAPNAPIDDRGSQPQLSKSVIHVATFSASLGEPDGRNAFTTVSGTISYTMRILTLDPAPPAPQEVAVVDLQIEASLTDIWSRTPVGRVSGSTHAEVALHDSGPVDAADDASYFEKTYPVTGRPAGTVLGVRYRVTRSGIEVARVYLASKLREPVAGTP